jgi:HSP20 family protein
MRLINYPLYRSSPSVTGFQRSPWAGLESQIDRIFESALSDFASPATANRFPVDLYEDKNNTYVRAELPGLSRDDINVEVVDDYLTITAARKSGDDADGESYSFSRSLTLPDQVLSDNVSATFENGVLTVTLPKREEAKPRKINVTVK